MPQSVYLNDIVNVLAGMASTALWRTISLLVLERQIPGWHKLQTKSQGRIAVEIATIPGRIYLGYVVLPIVLTGFTPLDLWQAEHTQLCLHAW
jgi:hypothetical protein